MTRQLRDHAGSRDPILTQAEATGDLDRFDRFAEGASRIAGQALFFALCVLLVVIWAPSYFVFGKLNTWQLVINTATTIITFLLVALLQNTQRRTEIVLQRKLDAIAAALADLMEHTVGVDTDLRGDIERLERAVGLEKHMSA